MNLRNFTKLRQYWIVWVGTWNENLEGEGGLRFGVGAAASGTYIYLYI